MQYRQYYSELAKLLYAVAYSDRFINNKEKERIRTIVKKSLVPDEKHVDKFGTDVAYYVEIELDILLENLPNPQSQFDSYLNFIEKHSTAISESLLTTSLAAAKKISETSGGTNKAEKRLINLLERKVNEIFLSLKLR